MLYKFVNFAPMYFMMIVDIFNFENIFNVYVQCHPIFFCFTLLFKINLHIISRFAHFTDLSSGCDITSAFSSTATSGTSVFVVSIGAPVKLPSNSSIILFHSKKSLLYNVFSFEYPIKESVLSSLSILYFFE